MLKTRGQRFALMAMLAMVGLVVFTLHAGVGLTDSEDSPSQIRMSVDPIVLPVIGPDAGESDEQNNAPAPVEATEEAGSPAPLAPESPASAKQPQVKPAPAPAPKPGPAPAPKSEPAPKPKPAPQPAQKPEASSASPGAVSAIAISPTKSGFTLTITCDHPVGDTSYLNLSNPSRLVIDLNGAWNLKTANVVRASSGKVKHVVVGEHPDKMRFVVHFNAPVRGKLTPEFKRSGNVLSVSVALP